MTKQVSNREAGNIWAGLIIAKLVDAWPLQIDIDLIEIIEIADVSIGDDKIELDAIVDLIKWLYREQYINSEELNTGGVLYSATVTNKSLVLLNEMPSFLNNKKLGDAMVDVAKDIGKESAKSSIADLFGQFIGGIVKNVGS